MVFILKEESENSPGIAVFSHTEFKKFSNYKVFNLILKNLSNYFYFGVHWGDSYKNINQFDFENIDINFCYPEQLPGIEKKEILNIPLTTRSFIPSSIFYPNKDIEKEFDLIAVTRKDKKKYNLDLFLICSLLIRNNPDIKILICVSHPNYRKQTYDFLFNEFFTEILGSYINKNIFLKEYKQPPEQTQISEYLNKSRIFLFTSRKEGVAKVTAEAALCNLPVVMYKNFFGSANRGINKNYLHYYDSVENAYKVLSQILNDYNVEENIFTDELLDKNNYLELKKHLKEFYLKKNKNFIDNLDLYDLKNRLNSFKQDLPNKFVKNNNNLKNLFALKNFFEYKLDKKIKVSNVSIFKSMVLDTKISFNLRNIVFKLTPIFIIKWIRRKKKNSYNF